LDYRTLANEIKVVNSIAKKNSKYIVNIISFDIILLADFEQNKKPVYCGYYIMPRYYQMPIACLTTSARHLVTALECVHATGRVHNDLKPENVMMDNTGREVLIDFGLS
jgi:serine/threonine protein kinase